MNITPIITERWKIDGGVAFGVIPKSLWSRFYESDEHNLLDMVNRCLLVETDKRLVLIETGFGSKRDDKYYQYKYIHQRKSLSEAISAAGFSLGQVSDVVFTHLHDDHCGGAVISSGENGFEPLFPHANHWVSRAQYLSAKSPNKRESAAYFHDNIQAIEDAGLLRLVDHETEIIPGIGVLLRNGHTEGQMLPVLHTEHGRFLYSSDFIPSIAHVAPVWVASVDIQPILALQEKEEFLSAAADSDWHIIFEHDAKHEVCMVTKTIKGFEGVPAEWPR